MKIELNNAGFIEIRTCPEVMALLNQQAEEIAERAGQGFEAQPAQRTVGKKPGRARGRAAVTAASTHAVLAEAKHHVLLKAVQGSVS